MLPGPMPSGESPQPARERQGRTPGRAIGLADMQRRQRCGGSPAGSEPRGTGLWRGRLPCWAVRLSAHLVLRAGREQSLGWDEHVVGAGRGEAGDRRSRRLLEKRQEMGAHAEAGAVGVDQGEQSLHGAIRDPRGGSEHPLPLRVPAVRSPVVGLSFRGQGASSSCPTWLPASPHRGSLKKPTQSHVVIKFVKTENKENF